MKQTKEILLEPIANAVVATASQVPQGPHLGQLPPPQDSPAVAVPQVPPRVRQPRPRSGLQQDCSVPLEH